MRDTLRAIALLSLTLLLWTLQPEAARAILPQGPDPATTIAAWQRRLDRNPQGYLEATHLARAYAHQARATGNVADWQRAETAVRRALTIQPNYEPARSLLASILYSMHEFEAALAIASPLVDTGTSLQAIATVGDAQMALGNYTAAAAAYARWPAHKPAAALSSRLAALAEVHGELDRAAKLLQQAAELARTQGDYGETLAWYDYRLGDFYFRTGQLETAQTCFERSLATFAGYYLAQAGLGKVAAARGELPAAIAYYRQAVAQIPQPELVAALGDLYGLSGQPQAAAQQYRTVEYIARLADLNQQVYNRQLALFFANHDRIYTNREPLERALRLATTELEQRQDVMGWDTAAWTYFKTGKLEAAQAAMETALQWGTRSSHLFYHAGAIDAARGDRDSARQWLDRALALNPQFDPMLAREAQALLAELTN